MRTDKLRGLELEGYWATLLDRRMPLEDEVRRLIVVLKGHYLSHLKHNEQAIPQDEDVLVKELLEFHGEKRPYGNKDVHASVAFQLGWDYKRQLCYSALPDDIAEEAESLHMAVYAELVRAGWLYV